MPYIVRRILARAWITAIAPLSLRIAEEENGVRRSVFGYYIGNRDHRLICYRDARYAVYTLQLTNDILQ